MRIGLYDPYLDTLGGGEKYILDIATCLEKDNSVSLFWDDPQILPAAEKRFNIHLSRIHILPNIFKSQKSLLEKFLVTRRFDVIIFLSDGSVPWLFAKKNILLFQFPVQWVQIKSFMDKQKLARITSIICYSDFVKGFLDATFHKDAIVIPPAISLPSQVSLKKQNIILSVGRFTKAMNTKKQEVLIQAFKEMTTKGLKDWTLILAGGVLPEDEDFVERLRTLAKGHSIEIFQNISYGELQDLYQSAKIYWHAAGFGEDLEKYPERAEHFGITTLEAMAYGVVPVVFNAGGQREIIKNEENGLLWHTVEELQQKTQQLIENGIFWKRLSVGAKKQAETYSERKFCEKIQLLV